MLLFLFYSLALLNQELKEKFKTYTIIARYSSQQNKPIIRKLLYNLRKESILEMFLTVLCVTFRYKRYPVSI